MKTPTRLLLAAAIVCSVASTSTADTKSHRAAAEELLKVMDVATQLEKAIDQTIDLQAKGNPQIVPFKDVMKKFLTKHMSFAGLKDDFITIYTDTFTEAELKDITAFYKTPTGKKMAEKMPELTGKGMMLGQKRVQDNQAELREMIQEEASKPKQ